MKPGISISADDASLSRAPLVLVVDDDGMMRLLVREALEGGGFRVEEAQDGEEGEALFRALRPDVVLLDVVMPRRDGFETCASIRKSPTGERTPILMMTGLDDTRSVNRAYEVGATDFVTKPIAWPILSHRVRYLLRSSRAFEALARSEVQLAEAQRMAKLGYWEWDIERDEVYRSEELLRLLFGVPASGDLAPDQYAVKMHSDDVAIIEASLRAAREHGQPVNLEHRLVRSDGSDCILSLQSNCIHDAAGKIVRIRGTAQDITERRVAEERMRSLMLYDALTGLPNRQLFKEQFGRSLALAKRLKLPVAIMVLDLDRFQRVNETLGHEVGDAVLREIGSRLSITLREADCLTRTIDDQDGPSVARLDGDKFTIVLASLAQAQDVAKVARRVLAEVAQPLLLDRNEMVVTASVGIAVFPEDGDSADALMKNADSALNFAKEQGKNNYQFFSGSMNASAFQKLSLENALRKALERDELMLHYQPKVDAIDGHISGVEALIRWRHPDLGMVAPNDFIPLAEETGLIVPIGEWVLRTACRQLAKWHAEGFSGISVAVNMASQNFSQKEFVQFVEETIRAAGVTPDAVEIEVTESVLMQDMEATIAKLEALKAVGVKLSVDDFGTGYSSLAYLKRFPIDTLKIDRSFVRDVSRNRTEAAIANAIITLGRNLGLEVVAEGVENESQAVFLRKHGCHLFQGYLFSRPVSSDEITTLLEQELAAVH